VTEASALRMPGSLEPHPPPLIQNMRVGNAQTCECMSTIPRKRSLPGSASARSGGWLRPAVQ
jgi:hypothetical protein